MKKRFVFAIGALLCLGLAAPAKADLNVGKSGSANAFWYSSEQVSDTLSRTTSWYIGFYSSNEGTWANVYHDVFLCRTGEPKPVPEGDEEPPCTTELSRSGDQYLGDEDFSIDAITLADAHLDTHIDLWAYDAEGNRVGNPVSTHVVADWTGTGIADRDRGATVYSSGCMTFVGAFLGTSRSSVATASIDGSDLGETYDSYIGSFMWTDVYAGC